MNQMEKEKYTSRNWLIMSPQGKHTAVVCFDSAVSFAFMESRFPGWRMSALFQSERRVAEGKASRASASS